MSDNTEFNKLLLQNIERLGSDIRDNQAENQHDIKDIKDVVNGLKSQLVLYVTHLEKDTALKIRATEEKLEELINEKTEIFFGKHDTMRELLEDNKSTLAVVIDNQSANIKNIKSLKEGYNELSETVNGHSEILKEMRQDQSVKQKKNLLSIKLNKTIIYALIITLTCTSAVIAKYALTEQEFNTLLKIFYIK